MKRMKMKVIVKSIWGNKLWRILKASINDRFYRKLENIVMIISEPPEFQQLTHYMIKEVMTVLTEMEYGIWLVKEEFKLG